MSVKERLIEFINSKKISVRKFERECGLSYGYVSNMRVSLQPDKLKSISEQFPDLNTGWLLTGEGEMLKGEGGSAAATGDKGLLDLVQSQQRTIEMQAETIRNLTNK